MKIRTGFVSNSSSSSFIIAIKDAGKCSHCGRSDPDILDPIRRSYSDDTNVEDHWHDALEYCYDEKRQEIEAKCKEYENKGYKVYAVNISYHDSILNHLIHAPSITILFDGEK